MGKFKIDSKELSDFLRNMFINNEFDTKDIIFRLKKDGLYINATSASQSLFVSGHLNEEIFHEIVPFNFILNNISEFIKLIENFQDKSKNKISDARKLKKLAEIIIRNNNDVVESIKKGNRNIKIL